MVKGGMEDQLQGLVVLCRIVGDTYTPPHFVASPCNLIATDENEHAVT